MGNKEVTKGQFKAVQEFLLWENDNDNIKGLSPYGAYLDTCAKTISNDKLRQMMSAGMLSPELSTLVLDNERHLLVHDGCIRDKDVECFSKSMGDEGIIDITDCLMDELKIIGRYEEYCQSLNKSRQIAGDILSVTLWGYTGAIQFKEIVKSADIELAL